MENNTVKDTAKDAVKDTALAPLTREELATFYEASRISTIDIINTALSKSFEKYDKAFTDAMSTITDAIRTIGINYDNAILDVNKNVVKIIDEFNKLEKSRNEEIVATQKASIEAINSIAEKIDNAASLSRKQFYAIHGNKDKTPNPLFASPIYNKEQQLLWMEKSKGIISGACLSKGINKGNVYKYIYSAISEKYNLDELLKEYRTTYNFPNATMMEMIAASDALRSAFILHYERYIKKWNNGCAAQSVKEDSTSITDINNNNLNRIYSTVSKLSSTGKRQGTVYKKSYSIVSKANNLDVYQVADSIIKEHHLRKDTSVPVAISYDNELTEKFCEAIEKYLKERKNG